MPKSNKTGKLIKAAASRKRQGFGIAAFVLLGLAVASTAMAQNYTLTTLTRFDETDAYDPQGSLVISGNTLYGTISVGGAIDCGTVFSMPTKGGTSTILVNFNAENGANPRGGMILSGSTLYRTTNTGGTNGRGTVFSVPTTGGKVINTK